MKKTTYGLGMPMLSSVIMLLLMGTAHAALMDNLVFHATFDSDFNNQAGNLHVPTVTSDPTIDANAKFGAGSMHLDGDDELIFNDSATGGDLHLRDKDWSMSVWVNIESKPYTSRVNLFKHDNSQVQWFYQIHSSWQRYVTTYTSTGNPTGDWLATNSDIDQDGTWNHLALTMDRNSGANDGVTTVWLNGTAVATYNAEQSETVFGGSTIIIGGGGMPARLDDYGIWDRALTAEEIGTLSTSPIPEPMTLGLIRASCLGLLGYRRLIS